MRADQAATIQRVIQARQAELAAAEELSEAIQDARRAGITWSMLSITPGIALTVDQLRHRATKPSFKGSFAPRVEVDLPVRPPFDHEINVSQAAEQLSVSRAQIHRMARSGQLIARLDNSTQPPRMRLLTGVDGMLKVAD